MLQDKLIHERAKARTFEAEHLSSTSAQQHSLRQQRSIQLMHSQDAKLIHSHIMRAWQATWLELDGGLELPSMRHGLNLKEDLNYHQYQQERLTEIHIDEKSAIALRRT